MSEQRQAPRVLIAGNPNAGKTTLFNALTDGRVRVGNYPGITIEQRRATIALDNGQTTRQIELSDIPGTYSLLAHTGEEQIAMAALLGWQDHPKPDLAILCVDASQVTRGWYLVVQAQELGIPLIVALTMVDEAGQATPDPAALSAVSGCEVVTVSAPKGIGLDRLRAAIARALDDGPERSSPIWRWSPTPDLQQRVTTVRAALPETWQHSDAVALWALMSIADNDELEAVDDDLRTAVARAMTDAAPTAGDDAAAATDHPNDDSNGNDSD
ncbi:MAG: FeoB small GTPase domain-containing protein, partial [Myxococcota bacterium]